MRKFPSHGIVMVAGLLLQFCNDAHSSFFTVVTVILTTTAELAMPIPVLGKYSDYSKTGVSPSATPGRV